MTDVNSSIASARDTFLDNLHAMATGSYLHEEDKEFWEAPYPESVVNEARVILDSFIDASKAAPRGDSESYHAALTTAVEDLVALSDRHEGAVLEAEELEDFTALVRALNEELGVAEEETLADLESLLEGEE